MPAEEEEAAAAAVAAGGPRLCGYLQRLSGKGPLRAFRSRWFAFDARRCELCYYRGPREAQPLGRLELAHAAFRLHDPPAPGPGPAPQPEPAEEERRQEDGAPGTTFEVHGPGGDVAVLRAATHQDMMYWLQELQQKRWEYCHTPDAAKRYSQTSPTPAGCSRGLVAKDSPDCTALPANALAEKARHVLAVEIAPTELVGEQAACLPAPGHPSPINFSLRQLGTDIRNSVSSLRTGKGSGENRRSVFYTEEWEMLDPSPKDLQESAAQEERRRLAAEPSKGGTGLTFPFDFGRLPHKARRPSKDPMASGKGQGSPEASPLEWNGGRPAAEMQLKLQSQQENLEQLKTELASQKELVRLLQQTVRSSQYDRYLAGPLCDGSTKGHLELLHQKDHQILGLNHQLEKLSLEKEHLREEVASLKASLGELGEQLEMLMETIQAKDEVIVKLSRELSEGESSWQGTPADPSLPGSKEQQELSKLKHTSLEARMCQVESRYLVLLQERKAPVCLEEPNPNGDLVAQLLEDALKVDSGELPEQAYFKPHMVSEYDMYGFQTVPEDEAEEERLEAKVRALDLKSLSLTEHQEMSTGVKWENFLAATAGREMVRTVELKNLIRAGVPHEHRCQIWKWCVGLHVKKLKERSSPSHFQELLQDVLKKQNPASKQIELDLLRTLPNNKHYSSPTSEGIQKLRNVLLAFSWRNPDIGYCQGLNRLAAIALLYLEQEDAFWCLVAIVEVFMPRDYYTKTLLGSQVDQRVFKDLMNEKLPRLHTHFEQHRVDFSLITFNWFLVVFVDSVVSDLLFKIWDSFLYEGPKVIFRFALALFKYKEEEILKLQDSTSIFKYLRSFTRTVLDARKLISIAFRDLNPFPLRQIRNRRAFHLEKVRLELLELEAMREDFLRERETDPEKRDLISEDEEDG
uniref:TBC1 domain family member 2B n=1 Tax=Naja naja TaxID=35670 RepID=A0A8C6YCZ6_NAJNA